MIDLRTPQKAHLSFSDSENEHADDSDSSAPSPSRLISKLFKPLSDQAGSMGMYNLQPNFFIYNNRKKN